MANFVDSKCPGQLKMSGKVNLGVPRNKIKSDAGSISKQDKRGEDNRIFK